MELGLAASFFNTTPIDGWDPAGSGTWVIDVARGTLQVYDRFVSDRTFGAKKRLLEIGDRSLKLPAQYGVVRLPGNRIYMLESLNIDAAGANPYSDVYVMHEATARIEVYSMVSGALPSGLPGPAVPTLQATYWGDTDRYGSTDGEFNQIRREIDIVWLERGAIVGPESRIRVGGYEYIIREIGRQLDLVYCRVERVT